MLHGNKRICSVFVSDFLKQYLCGVPVSQGPHAPNTPRRDVSCTAASGNLPLLPCRGCTARGCWVTARDVKEHLQSPFQSSSFQQGFRKGGCFCAMAVAQQKQNRGQLHPNPPPRALGFSQDDHHSAGPGEETEITCAEEVSCLA